ncbi:MAG: hypothetical protein DRO88_14290 [Promethearchaeia archaeon]|nr:MAG: hypothetical protein DRO88_14290 [Candidatus Lokiarchaeia archaeon]
MVSNKNGQDKIILMPCMGCEKLLGQLTTMSALQIEKNKNIENITLDPPITKIAANEYKHDLEQGTIIALNGCGTQCVSKILNEKSIKPNFIISIPKLAKTLSLPKEIPNTLELNDGLLLEKMVSKIEYEIQKLLENSKSNERAIDIQNFTFNPKYTEELSFTHSKFIFRVATSSGNIFFNWNDAWAYHLGDGKIIVGISDYLQQNLSDILFCEFPDIGSQIDQFEAVATLESSKTVNEVLTPFSGKIIAINPRLKDEPELINMDPYKDGWIVMIQATNFEEEKEDLMDSKAYFEFMKEKVEEEGIH